MRIIEILLDGNAPSRKDLRDTAMARMLAKIMPRDQRNLGPRLASVDPPDAEDWSWLTLRYDATGHSWGGTPLEGLMLMLRDGGWVLKPLAVNTDAWDSSPGGDDMRDLARRIAQVDLGIGHVNFSDWDHDDNPWYHAEPEPGGLLDHLERSLSDPSTRQRFRRVLPS